ncbi:MAG: dUTP diphosphatase [Proteobacteria bacterium]|nr:dUTP diphosphatase [Pseudomonadota bacterium]
MLKYFLNEKATKLNLELKVPRAGDAGFDLPCLEDTEIPVAGFALVPTGVHLSIPEGWVGLLRDRSSMALKGATIVAGVIDASYRGEVKIAMHNLGKQPLVLKVGERIAQCLVVPHLAGSESLRVNSEAELGDTERGSGGFGSTGK